MNDTSQQGFGSRAMRALTRLVVTLLLLALAGTVAFLLSQLNARTFTLEVESGHLVVMRGRMLPWGATPYRPGDLGLADTYAPIPLEGHEVPPSLLTQRYTERDELDRTLFSQLEALARPRIASDEPRRVERGVYYLRRAERLTGLGEEQRTSLKHMLAEVAYYQARQKMEDARKLIAEALSQLRLASEEENRHSRSANQMLTAVEPATVALEQALRSAVHTLSGPPSQEVRPPAPTTPGPPAPGSEAQPPPPSLDPRGSTGSSGTPEPPPSPSHR
ncbi:IF-2 protein [Hyalangium sp.]|uniref:IF-2 protein n=1 Tax=Hyalangium sp. TaxID=2028555 RepID=UPI002D5E5927|nr:IF-2 protein [Hyalangium sp.]HYH98785.1 IF-2 protein [Hyalangium sp.]